MRIALVCPYSLDVPGGVGMHVLGLGRWLLGEGHQVVVVAPGTRAQPGTDGMDVELVGGAVALPFNGSRARLALGPAQLRRARAAVVGADVVHVHEPLTPGLGYGVAHSAAGLVVTHHASFAVHPLLAAVLRARAAGLPARQSIAVSAAAAATAVAATGTDPVVIPNAIDLPAPRRARNRGKARIGFLGRADERRKGFPVFRQLAELASRRGVDARFVAAGQGRVDPGPVRHLGHVEDRFEYLRSLDVLVAPNLSGESFGMILVEALAAGCDVVASDLPAFREVLDEAGVGAVAPTGDAEGFLAVLERRLAAPVTPLLAAESARRWGWESVGPRVLAVYRRASGMA